MRTFKRWWKRRGRPWCQGVQDGLAGSGGTVELGHMEDLASDAWKASWVRIPKAARDVLQERERQTTEEGYSTSHDDQHRHGELAIAAAVYAMLDGDRNYVEVPEPEDTNATQVPALWPWLPDSFRPAGTSEGGRRRELVKAGALILAELERLDRHQAQVDGKVPGGTQ